METTAQEPDAAASDEGMGNAVPTRKPGLLINRCSDFDTQMCSKALDAQSSLFLLH